MKASFSNVIAETPCASGLPLSDWSTSSASRFMAPAPREGLLPAEAFFFGIVPYKLYRATVFAPFLPVFPRTARASPQLTDAMFEEIPSTPFISPAQGMNAEKKGLSGIGSNEAQGFKRPIYRLDLLQIGALLCETGKKLEKPADAMRSGRVLRRSQSTKHQTAWQPRWRRIGSGVATMPAPGREGGLVTAQATGRGRRGDRAGDLAAALAAWQPRWRRAGRWQPRPELGGRAGSTGGLRPCWLRAGGWQASETHRR